MKISVDGKNLTLDSNQLKVLDHLNKLEKSFNKDGSKKQKKTFLESFFSNSRSLSQKVENSQNNPLSLYIHGHVGRGKSMLMNYFFENITIKNKLHLHFNDFMQKVHRELHRLRKCDNKRDDDLVESATKNIIKDNILLCFDEFQVEDVADALILRRMFTWIFNNNIKVVFTSNTHPESLYKNGLQRDLFLKFIHEVLSKNCQIVNLDSDTDYRGTFAKSVEHYFSPIDPQNKKKISDISYKITDGNKTVTRQIEVVGDRKLTLKNTYKNIVIFDFKELCVENLGVADYQKICQEFDIIFLLNIPKLTKEDRNEAKRLILFIDEVYQNKNMLFILADSKAEEIYTQGTGAKTFYRTASRLNEIMSNYQK